MADYWKSHARHHCDFCKCWIADNKPSRDFHEKGKRHQENVKKKLDEIRKKGLKDAEQKAEMEDSLVEMERAAIEALKADLMKDPSLAAQYGVTFKSKEPSVSSVPANESVTVSGTEVSSTKSDGKEATKSDEKVKTAKRKSATKVREPVSKLSKQKPTKSAECFWKAEVTPEGYTYYWNTQTLERTWIKPDDYVEPDEEKEEETQSQSDEEQQSTSESDSDEELGEGEKEGEPVNVGDIPLPGVPDLEAKEDSEDDALETEPMSAEDDNTVIPDAAVGPQLRPDGNRAYGQWEKIVIQEEPQVDLQLPKQEVPEVTVIPAETKMKFREKKVESLGDEMVLFKKRKMNKKPFNFRKKEGDS